MDDSAGLWLLDPLGATPQELWSRSSAAAVSCWLGGPRADHPLGGVRWRGFGGLAARDPKAEALGELAGPIRAEGWSRA